MSLRSAVRALTDKRILACHLRYQQCARFSATASSSPNRSMAPPTTVERVLIDGREYRSVREGLASILAPFKESDANQVPSTKPRNNDEGEQAVFYNPIQQFNRDLSVLAILVYGECAVLQKQQKFQNKGQKTKNRKENASKRKAKASTNGEPTAVQEHPMPVQDQPSKKRKLEEASVEIDSVDAKRSRIDDGGVEDDDLEVLELAIDAEPEGEAEKTISSEKETNDPITKPGPNASSTEGTLRKPKETSVGFTILDALSATGLRALRYAKEIPFATNVIANDLLPDAVKAINLNIKHNNLSDLVHSNVGDARAYMYSKVGNERQPAAGKYVHRFDVIDLDPYGTAAPFLDSAVQALQDGGLLCVTCTDASVFASNGYPEKTYALYGGLPLKGAFSHEGGLRLILHAVATSAAKYGIAIEPLLSLSIDFYARLFIRVHKQQQEVKLLAGTSMIVYNCDQGCGAWTTQLLAKNVAKEDKKGDLFFKHGFAQGPSVGPTCEHCGFKTHLGGPMWAGPLHNPYFVQRILDRLPSLDSSTYQTLDRLQGMLTLALEEDLTLSSSNETDTSQSPTTDPPAPIPKPPPTDLRTIPRLPPATIDASPFFFIPNYVAKVLHCQTPSEDSLRGALRHLGYRVTRSHCKPGSFRTTAPWSVIWEVMREWVRTKAPIKEGALKVGTAGWKVMEMARGERRVVRERREGLEGRLRKCETLGEMKGVLEGEMYRFEHPTINGIEGTVGGEGVDEIGENEAVGHSNGIKPAELKIVFDERLGREKPRGKLVRYQINPRANWGPMNRAAGNS
jgi:tRNA (guanine26-N2/guanine27-N2)-dimethyltransferase